MAHTTRRKLSCEASRADHDLRVLVGHANFLDSLMIELADANKRQEQSVATVSEATKVPAEAEARRTNDEAITVTEKAVDDWEVWESDESDSSDSDAGDDKGANWETATDIPFRPTMARSDTLSVMAREVAEDDDDDEDYGDLGLVRTVRHFAP